MEIKVIDISKVFDDRSGKVEVFRHLNLHIQSGEFVSILGPNGCGKTTLFNLINGLDKDYSGQIKINSANPVLSTGYMMQKDLLLPWRTVYQNIIIGLEIQNRIDRHTRDFVSNQLKEFGISNFIDTYPAKLSGGERQKVSLIRTLILNPDILLLDEPFSSIDYNTRLELQKKVHHISKEHAKTVLLITHDIDEAIALSDRVILLNNKPHGILKTYKIDLEIDDRTPLTARQSTRFAEYFSEIWQDYPKSITKT